MCGASKCQVVRVDYKAFREFLQSQMRAREFASGREFARFVGVSYTTINYFLSDVGVKDRVPSMEVLEKLAEKTSTELIQLLNIVFPRLRAKLTIDGLTPDEYRLLQAFRRKDNAEVLAILSERLRQAFGNDSGVPKNK